MKNKFNFQKELRELLAREYQKALSEAVKRGVRESKRKNNEPKTIGNTNNTDKTTKRPCGLCQFYLKRQPLSWLNRHYDQTRRWLQAHLPHQKGWN